jgi:hypothetical protein
VFSLTSKKFIILATVAILASIFTGVIMAGTIGQSQVLGIGHKDPVIIGRHMNMPSSTLIRFYFDLDNGKTVQVTLDEYNSYHTGDTYPAV